jgi:hypothetical protein
MERIVSKEQIAASLRSASENFFDAALHLDRYDIIGEATATAHQALEDAMLASESWRSEPMPVKIPGRPYQSLRPLQLTPLLLSETGLQEENLVGLATALIRIESSPRTTIVSQGGEAIIRQVEEQDAPDETLVILRKAFAKLAAIRDAGGKF